MVLLLLTAAMIAACQPMGGSSDDDSGPRADAQTDGGEFSGVIGEDAVASDDGSIDAGMDSDGDAAQECIPEPETCNGQDDDCDGEVDEDIGAEPIECGVGMCHAPGLKICQGGLLVDDCTPGIAQPESCDGLDNDCDGEIDEEAGDLPAFCIEDEMISGTWSCTVNGAIFSPDFLVLDGCDGAAVGEGVDNDCDGLVDEDVDPLTGCGCGDVPRPPVNCVTFPVEGRPQGACQAGQRACLPNGFWSACGDPDPELGLRQEIRPTTEGVEADDIDNDCDGRVDEGTD